MKLLVPNTLQQAVYSLLTDETIDCTTQSQTIEYSLSLLPDYRVLDEFDAHGMTPESAPHTWAFLGKMFMHYDVVAK